MNGELMAAEIAEQPEVLHRLVERGGEIADRVRGLLPQPLAGITLLARGSSDHAAIYGRYIMEMAAGRPAGLAAPSIHTLYRARVDLSGYLAVGISQSGETPEIVTALGRLGAEGASTIAIVNSAGSPLSAAATATIVLGAGEERAVPATKTVTATLLALALVARGLGDVPWKDPELDLLPERVSALLADQDPAEKVATLLDGADRLIVTGRGMLLAAALETALKLRETSGILAEGISPADLRHGPIAAIGEGFPVLEFAAEAVEPDAPDLVALLRERGARVLTVGPSSGAVCPLPRGLAPALLPILAVVRGQQLAAAVARFRHLDPDSPAGLTKVTSTR